MKVMSKKQEPRHVTPTLESITVRGKYEIPETDFEVIHNKVIEVFKPLDWHETIRVGESIRLIHWKPKKKTNLWKFDLKTGKWIKHRMKQTFM